MLTSRLSSLKLFAFLLAVALNLMILLGYGVDSPTDNISSSTKDRCVRLGAWVRLIMRTLSCCLV